MLLFAGAAALDFLLDRLAGRNKWLQHQLVSFVAIGWTNKEIASTVHLSEQTVKNHMHRILRQVNAGDRYQAVETILSFGLLS